ncbi:MAG: ATP-grasp domain-containing protein [Gammaproteobacteria bacterium]|nr:ATP-grasp domain-containing protein [Gammaproteobacteria bacterium]
MRRLRRRARGLRLRQGAVARRGERAARRLLLVAPHASYRTAPYIEAAQAAGVEPFLLCARSALDLPAHIAGAVHDAGDTDTALRIAAERHSDLPFDGVCVTDDATAELGARIARHLGLNGNDPAAAALTNDKLRARRRLADAGVASPDFACVDLRDRSAATSARPSFPLVVKPLSMSASRGVIRVDDEAALIRALDRIERLLAREFAEPDFRVLVERYIPGFEVAVEGLLTGGILEVWRWFRQAGSAHRPLLRGDVLHDAFALVSRHRRAYRRRRPRACGALGWSRGPVHAECRVNAHGVWPLEVAARTIGGKCARLLTFATGRTTGGDRHRARGR